MSIGRSFGFVKTAHRSSAVLPIAMLADAACHGGVGVDRRVLLRGLHRANRPAVFTGYRDDRQIAADPDHSPSHSRGIWGGESGSAHRCWLQNLHFARAVHWRRSTATQTTATYGNAVSEQMEVWPYSRSRSYIKIGGSAVGCLEIRAVQTSKRIPKALKGMRLPSMRS